MTPCEKKNNIFHVCVLCVQLIAHSLGYMGSVKTRLHYKGKWSIVFMLHHNQSDSEMRFILFFTMFVSEWVSHGGWVCMRLADGVTRMTSILLSIWKKYLYLTVHCGLAVTNELVLIFRQFLLALRHFVLSLAPPRIIFSPCHCKNNHHNKLFKKSTNMLSIGQVTTTCPFQFPTLLYV